MSSSTGKQRKTNASRAEWLIGLSFLAIVGLIAHQQIKNQKSTAQRSSAMRQMRSIGLAMLEFDQEYGSYPDDKTAPVVTSSTGTDLSLESRSSNAYFRQLVAYGIQSEDIFFAVHPEGSHKPDRILTKGQALTPGEVGLSYSYGLNTSSDPKIPLLLAPMKTGTHLAWHQPFGNKAAVLRNDHSVEALDLNRRGEILLPDGSRLLDPTQPYWHGKAIDIRHPEFP